MRNYRYSDCNYPDYQGFDYKSPVYQSLDYNSPVCKSPVYKRPVFHKCIPILTAAACAVSLFFSSATCALAASEQELRLETHRALEVQSNEISGWPTGPVVGAEAAILMEAETGAILYAKNIHQREYPASTTKILTALIASEQCELDEIVTFSHNAVFDTPRDSNHIAMDVGQELTMEQSLNAILIRSANEVAYAIAEHISGTTNWQDFGDIMNARAKELGCLDSHFANPNGLPDENHFTTAYDLAMIGRAFFSNEMLCKMTLTRRLEIPASDKLPQQKLELNQMKIIPGGEYAYEYLVGCKTGYTQAARSCLVSCAEKNGMRLICVVLQDEQPYQYQDTISLFEYGFANFEKVKVAQLETKYNIDNTGLFYSGNDIFGNSQPLLTLNQNDFILLPNTLSFEEIESEISYETTSEDQAAVIFYSYEDMALGSVRVNYVDAKEEAYVFDTLLETEDLTENDAEEPVIYINKTWIAILLAIVASLVLLRLLLFLLHRNFAFPGRDDRRRRRHRSRRRR